MKPKIPRVFVLKTLYVWANTGLVLPAYDKDGWESRHMLGKAEICSVRRRFSVRRSELLVMV